MNWHSLNRLRHYLLLLQLMWLLWPLNPYYSNHVQHYRCYRFLTFVHRSFLHILLVVMHSICVTGKPNVTGCCGYEFFCWSLIWMMMDFCIAFAAVGCNDENLLYFVSSCDSAVFFSSGQIIQKDPKMKCVDGDGDDNDNDTDKCECLRWLWTTTAMMLMVVKMIVCGAAYVSPIRKCRLRFMYVNALYVLQTNHHTIHKNTKQKKAKKK